MDFKNFSQSSSKQNWTISYWIFSITFFWKKSNTWARLKLLGKRCSVKNRLNKKQRGSATCSLASFKAQAGMSDGSTNLLCWIYQISFCLSYTWIKICYCSVPHYYRIDTVLCYQIIHLTLKFYSWEDWQYHFDCSKSFQNCFWVLVLLSLFFHCFWFHW